MNLTLPNITRKNSILIFITLIISAILFVFFMLLIFTHINTSLTLLLYAICILIFFYILLQFKKIAIIKKAKANSSQLNETLLNALSHELLTPISVIIGATDNLLQENSVISSDDKEGLLTEISIAALRLNQQVESLLNASRLQSGLLQPKKDWCDIQELVNDILVQLHDQLKDHVVNVFIKERLPLFKIDRGLLEQVVYNLINNAALYTPAKSVITITAAEINKQLVLIVEDNGKGFSENEAAKVFNKFYRLNNNITGTGLGLYIAKGFTEVHGGSIALEKSNLGGAKFIVKIPTKTISLKTTEK